jgi:hypothetical protein
MFKGFNNRQQHSFPNINFGGNYGVAYNFNRCLLWLDAAYGTSTVVNGASVSSWQDKINNVQFTQTSVVSQPFYILSDANFNNFPALNFFSFLGRFLRTTTSFALGTGTLAIIMRATTNTQVSKNLILGDGSTIGFASGGANAAITGYGFYNGNIALTRTNVEDANMHIVIANRDYIIIDGVNQTSATSNVFLNFTHIGGGDGNNSTACAIAEILIYDYQMSETEAIQLSSNINAKYLKY